MMHFEDFIKQLKKNLQYLKLDLSQNSLGTNYINIKYLGHGIK